MAWVLVVSRIPFGRKDPSRIDKQLKKNIIRNQRKEKGREEKEDLCATLKKGGEPPLSPAATAKIPPK